MERPRVLLADDHTMFAECLKGLLHDDCELVGTVENGAALLEAVASLSPDIIVMDISMPVMNGLEAAREISRIDPSVPLLICTMFKSEQLVTAVRKVGVKRVLSKWECLGNNLVNAIESLIHN